MPRDDATFCFVHIQKCAGTSVRRVIANTYGEAFLPLRLDNPAQLLERAQKEKGLVVAGHVEFGLARDFWTPLFNSSARPRYFTFLRHPGRRAISYYYFVKAQQSGKNFRDFLVNNKITLEQYLNLDVDHPVVHMGNNWMTKVFATFGQHVSYHFQPTAGDLERAKDNLARHMDFVGFVEDYEASMRGLAGYLGLDDLSGERANVNARKPKSLPPDLLGLATRRNLLDMELYAFALERFAPGGRA